MLPERTVVNLIKEWSIFLIFFLEVLFELLVSITSHVSHRMIGGTISLTKPKLK